MLLVAAHFGKREIHALAHGFRMGPLAGVTGSRTIFTSSLKRVLPPSLCATASFAAVSYSEKGVADGANEEIGGQFEATRGSREEIRCVASESQRKFYGDETIAERAIVTLASERALLLARRPSVLSLAPAR